MTARWGYLGPEGTFTEQAARTLAATADVELLPTDGVSAAFAGLRSAHLDAAVVPMENSVEGAVPLTQDELTHGPPVIITAEAFVAVTLQLLVRPGTTLAQIRTVGSHPHGLAQVRSWLRDHLPHVEMVVTGSTAAAAADVAAGRIDAAAAAPVAGERFALQALAADIGFARDAVTRFVLLERPRAAPSPTGNDRSSLIISVDNRPGTLLAVLSEFAVRGINMTRLESRPTRSKLGEYVFLIDTDGHLADPAMSDMVAALIRRSALRRWLGSYPRAFGTNVPLPDFAQPTAYDAAAWEVQQLLGRSLR